MKKISGLQYVVLFFSSLLMFTSCITGEGGTKDSGPAFGVVGISDKTFENVLYVDEITAFYNIRFANKYPGDCFYVYFELDHDAPENSYENLVTKGYYTINVIDMDDISRWELAYSLTDTSQVLPNEVPLLEGFLEGEIYNYVKGMAFFASGIEMPSDQQMIWDLSYNSMDIVKEEGGQRYYDLFLRAMVRYPGSKSPEKRGVINAFNMKSYLEMVAQREKTLGSSTFKIRINYAAEIKDETITWKQQASRGEIPVAWILNE